MPDIHKAEEKKSSSGFLYWQYGSNKQKPLVLIPGFTGTHKDLSHIANILKEKHMVLIPEFPGWEDAKNAKSSYTISAYAKVVNNLLTDLQLVDVVIVAHCMGGVIACEAAYEDASRIKDLVLISIPYQGGTLGQNFFLLMAKLSEKVPSTFRPVFFFWRSRLITSPLSLFVLKTRSFRRKLSLIEGVVKAQSSQNEHVLETNWDSLIYYNYAKLRKLRVPVHLLHGEKDLLIPVGQAEKLADMLPHATCTVVPRAGHLPPVETPETVVRLITQYLN